MEATWLSGQSWGFEWGKIQVQIPNSDYWMNLSSAIPGANSPHFVNSQLAYLLSIGILNWDLNMTLKSPFRGVVIRDSYIHIFSYIHCWWLKMLVITADDCDFIASKIRADREQGAFKMRADHDHDKPCARDLNASTCTRVSEWHCRT